MLHKLDSIHNKQNKLIERLDLNNIYRIKQYVPYRRLIQREQHENRIKYTQQTIQPVLQTKQPNLHIKQSALKTNKHDQQTKQHTPLTKT